MIKKDELIGAISIFRHAEGTRYYNIDFFVGGKSTRMGDPIKNWHAKIGAAILELPKNKPKRPRLFRLWLALRLLGRGDGQISRSRNGARRRMVTAGFVVIARDCNPATPARYMRH
jgi:hypothetical protein